MCCQKCVANSLRVPNTSTALWGPSCTTTRSRTNTTFSGSTFTTTRPATTTTAAQTSEECGALRTKNTAHAEPTVQETANTKTRSAPVYTCPTNERFNPCVAHCQRNCTTEEFVPCIRICVPGCICEEGYIRGFDGKCIAMDQCPRRLSSEEVQAIRDVVGESTALQEVQEISSQDEEMGARPSCPVNEHWYVCKFLCQEKCVYVPCSMVCKSGCVCDDGLVRSTDGKCIKPEQCETQEESLPT
ncbi:hypothetical protein JTE90_007091 [Oedothorax gibbosus]|uniref:TIL domain-containing protein n=1 Tax=Oedothorax gibbosus TaxID=931172 RepID=A0AAV6VSQ4_9ARAC|nr:hypothetical protein JTE90_007091 [Oedothorax gibbosus]